MPKPLFCLAHQGAIALDRIDITRKPRQDGGLIARAGTDLQHP